jgi:hypothetical protein
MNSRANIHPRAGARKNRAQGRRRPAHRIATRAAERRLPKMHWRWCRRGRDILALLQSRFGLVLPNDDAGMDTVNLLTQHYMRLLIDAERVTRANLRLWAPWLTEKAIAGVIRVAKKIKTPSAAKLGKDFRVTAHEVAALALQTVTAFTVTQEQDRTRQARRRRKSGAGKRRGRPSMGLSAEEKKARSNAQAAQRMKAKRAQSTTGRPRGRPKNPLRKNSHAPSYIRELDRDELSVTELIVLSAPPIVPARAPQSATGPDDVTDDEIVDGGCAWAPPPHQRARTDLTGGVK